MRGGEQGDRVARTRVGRWWWIDHQGNVTTACGIQGVDATVGNEPADAQVAGWGFNLLLPPWADAFALRGARHMRNLDLARAADAGLSEDGVRLPDVFDPAWEDAVGQLFNALKPTSGLIAWAGDLALRWGGWTADDEPLVRPGLLQVCLSLDPTKRAYHAAWEFALARHEGDLASLAEAWQVDLPSRGHVRELTRQDKSIDSPAYRRDLSDFVAEFSERYFAAVGEAAAKVNGDLLLCSPVMGDQTPGPVVEAATRHCAFILTEQVGISQGRGPELWMVEGWSSPDLLSPLNLGESNLEAVIRNGREWLCAGLRHPNVVGYVWSRFRGGDLMLNDPFTVGLVDENGRPNVLLTHPLEAINRAASDIRVTAPDPQAP